MVPSAVSPSNKNGRIIVFGSGELQFLPGPLSELAEGSPANFRYQEEFDRGAFQMPPVFCQLVPRGGRLLGYEAGGEGIGANIEIALRHLQEARDEALGWCWLRLRLLQVCLARTPGSRCGSSWSPSLKKLMMRIMLKEKQADSTTQ